MISYHKTAEQMSTWRHYFIGYKLKPTIEEGLFLVNWYWGCGDYYRVNKQFRTI